MRELLQFNKNEGRLVLTWLKLSMNQHNLPNLAQQITLGLLMKNTIESSIELCQANRRLDKIK
jgi:hypothetical protein